MNTLKILFSRKWLFATLIVLLAIVVMARLGKWQLDRLEARRAFNQRVTEQLSAPELVLDAEALDTNLYEMEYRSVRLQGIYLPEEEIILRNQIFEGRVGYQLFTPLLLEGSNTALLIQRGWIPEEFAQASFRDIYAEHRPVEIVGIIRRAETDFGLRLIPDPTLSSDETRLDAWNNLDINRLSDQMEMPLADVYVQIWPSGDEQKPPFPQHLQLELTEGPHLGYAGQWFILALLLGAGYPLYVRKQSTGAEVE